MHSEFSTSAGVFRVKGQSTDVLKTHVRPTRIDISTFIILVSAHDDAQFKRFLVIAPHAQSLAIASLTTADQTPTLVD